MDIISMRDLDKKTIEDMLNLAEQVEKDGNGKKTQRPEKIVATVFFEPSTRTKLSFHSAALRSGMNYIDFQPDSSSLRKGESYEDTVRVISSYADVLVIRHAKEGAARLAADLTETPVINAGDGANQHPTQTLIDLYTIRKYKGRIAGLNVTLFGDLKYARSMRSLIYGLAMFGANITLVAPHGLGMDPEYLEAIRKKFKAKITLSERPGLDSVDVFYVCRVQQERFSDPYEAKTIMERFTIRKSDLKEAKEDMIILHPLPRINELDPEIDSLKQAKYFEQAKHGVVVRQAILEFVLNKN